MNGSSTPIRLGSCVPLVVPSPAHLRAGAVWITIANWAEVLADRFGDAPVISPDRIRSADEVRSLAWRRGSGGRGSPSALRSRVPEPAITALKDARAWVVAHRFNAWVRSSRWASDRVPFVWQHHDPWQTAGLVLARQLQVPLVQFVDALQVWEASQWGVSRPGWGKVLELVGEVGPLRRADLVCCVSEEVAAEVIARGVPAQRVLVTPCTADAARFGTLIERDAIRSELGLTGAFVVGWVGSFRPFHALDDMLEALELAAPKIQDLRVLLVGDGPERARIEAKAASIGLPVTFTGAVAHERMPSYIGAMDVTVIAAAAGSSFHYSPLKLKEFQAAGRAVIAPAVGEIGRELRHLEHAWLYTPGDVSGIAFAAEQLSRDRDLREALGARGRARHLAVGSIDRQVSRVVARLEELRPAARTAMRP